MSTELFTPRSHPPAIPIYGSTYSCSSSEASSRLAARLERSEYKRSRAKQRMSNSFRNHGRRKDSNRTSRTKNSSTRETLTKSEGDGVTSVWEVYRQNPYYYSDRVAGSNVDKIEHRNTWYGMPSSTGSRSSERRPQSIHIGFSDYSNLEYQNSLSRKQTERNLFHYSLDENSFDGSNEEYKPTLDYRTNNSPRDRNTQNFTEIEGDFSLDKKGLYLSRSLSSSFSSYVGSSDEKDDSQGIYSAYDVASRSPYESMVRRYSQSSLSSSNASWHQLQSPTNNYNVREIPPLLDPLTSRHHELPTKSNSYYSHHVKGEFQPIKEPSSPAVPPKPGKFSSSYTIQLHSSKAKEPQSWGPHTNRGNINSPKVIDQTDNKGPIVREIARKFTPASVRHISSVYNTPELEDRNVRAEQFSSFENKSGNPSSPKDADVEKSKGVVMRQKEPSNKTPEELASHRLSLQELIRLHEEQIAIQAKSAQTNLTHVNSKRSPDVSRSKSTAFDSKINKTVLHDSTKITTGNSEIKTDSPVGDNWKLPSVMQEHADYEVREVVVSKSSPFKVIELTDKTSGTTKGRSLRLKRHRTIGIVGYRHQIDRTSEENIQTKLKRHTTVGIVSNFPDSSVEALTKSKHLLTKENKNVSPLKNTDTDQLGPGDNVTKKDNKKPFPVKIFDIESNLDQQHKEDSSTAKEPIPEKPIESVATDYWFSKHLSDEPFLDLDNKNKFSTVAHDSFDKTSGTISSITLRDNQKDLVVARSTSTDKHQSTVIHTSSQNSHSAIVELLPEKKSNPTAFDKSVTCYSYPHSKDNNIYSDATVNAKHNLNVPKSHLVPIAQVSPVSHSFGSQEVIEQKTMPLSSPPPEPPSAHEMYQTRLALLDLFPHRGKSNSDLSEHQSNEGHFSLGEHSKQSSRSIEKLPVKYDGQTYIGSTEPLASRLSLNFQRLDRTEDYYVGVIETLKAENQRLKEKNETERREFKRMYDEQKKVANAYQKLEDRYRRRVHELQDALASCTCHGSLVENENNIKSPHANHGKEKDSHTNKLQPGKSGMRMFEELEEWLSEQSKNSKVPKINGRSRDNLISSSSDLTGTGWDDHCDVLDGDIDEVNGTHV